MKNILSALNINEKIKIDYGAGLSEEGIILDIFDNGIKLDTDLGICLIFSQSITSIKYLEASEKPTVEHNDFFSHDTFIFDIYEEFNEVKYIVNESEDDYIVSKFNSIFDSITNSIKSNSIKSKSHNLKAKILTLSEDCPTHELHRAIDILLGLLHISAEEYEEAIYPLLRAKKFLLAAYSSEKINKKNQADVYKLYAYLSKEISINTEFTNICIRNKDVSAIHGLLNIAEPDDILSCLRLIYSRCNLQIPEFHDTDIKHQIQTMLEILTNDWGISSIIEEFNTVNNFNYDLSHVYINDETVHKGIVSLFNTTYKLGNIKYDDKTIFFSIRQVREEEVELRMLLANLNFEDLEVEFELGFNNKGIAATNIALSQKGLSLAQKKLTHQELQGFIAHYDNDEQWGYIRKDNSTYPFKPKNIIDPYLRAYFRYSYYEDIDFNVNFEIGQFNEKKIAINISKQEPFTDSEIQHLTDYIFEEDLQKWSEYLKQKESYVDIHDPYEQYLFYDLSKTNSSPEELDKLKNQHLEQNTFISEKSVYKITQSQKLVSATKINIEKCEEFLKHLFIREYYKLEKYTYNYIVSKPEEVANKIKIDYPDLNINLELMTKFCQGVSDFKEEPTLLDVLTLGYIIDVIITNWTYRFARFFKKAITEENLSQIKLVRNALSHGQADIIGDAKISKANEYCIAVCKVLSF